MKTFTLRDIPDEIFEHFKEIAQRDRRSINQEMIEVMDQAIQRDALRQQRQQALHGIAELRRSLPKRTREGKDSLTLLREDRER